MSGNSFDWLREPPKLKTVLSIWGVLFLGAFGPACVVLATVGNTSLAVPLWSGIVFWGCTLAFLSLVWRRPDLVTVPFACLVLFAAVSAAFGGRSMEYWPSHLLWGPVWPGYLLAGLWLAIILAVAWYGMIGGLHRAGFWTQLPSAALSAYASTQRRTLLTLAIGALFLTWGVFNAARLSIGNLAYWLAGEPDSMQLEVVDKGRQARQGRFQRGSDIVIGFCDATGHCQRIPLDDFYRREVDIHRETEPAHSDGMRLSWNQCFIPGDVLTVQGRRGWLGLAIDHVQNVRLVEGKRCE